MIPEKESLIYFEKLLTKQFRIYPDACDYGVILDTEMKIDARLALKKLMSTYEYKFTKSENGDYSETVMFIPFEYEEWHYTGVNLFVEYFKTRKIEFLAIRIDRAYFSKVSGIKPVKKDK
jgi:hypothetical protein